MAGSGPNPISGAGQYLLDLPTRGYFSSSVPSSTPGGMRIYVCDHDTSPPAEQLIKTDSTNILIRSLTLKKAKGDLKVKDKAKSSIDNGKGKRLAERAVDDKVVKKVNIGNGSTNRRKEGGSSRLSDKDIHSYTVEKLRSLLKERGLSQKGKKEELIARLKQYL